jgi:hypothetical protein
MSIVRVRGDNTALAP